MKSTWRTQGNRQKKPVNDITNANAKSNKDDMLRPETVTELSLNSKSKRMKNENDNQASASNGYFDDITSKLYEDAAHIAATQREMILSAWNLCFIGSNKTIKDYENSGVCILDIGCGSGAVNDAMSLLVPPSIASFLLGLDISLPMLELNKKKHQNESNLMRANMLSMPFHHSHENFFDFVLSISCVQWAASAIATNTSGDDKKKAIEQNLDGLFSVIARAMKSRCVLQFYPSNPEEAHEFVLSARKHKLFGGLIVDTPHPDKRTKFFLLFDKNEYIHVKSCCMLAEKFHHATCPFGLCMDNGWSDCFHDDGKVKENYNQLWDVHIRRLHQTLRLCKRMKEGGFIPEDELPSKFEIMLSDRIFEVFGGLQSCIDEKKLTLPYLMNHQISKQIVIATHPPSDMIVSQTTSS